MSSEARPKQGSGGEANVDVAVRAIVADVLELDDPTTLDPEAKLVEDLGMDSMMALEILATIEKRFRIKVPESNLPKMRSLRSIIEVIDRYVRA